VTDTGLPCPNLQDFQPCNTDRCLGPYDCKHPKRDIMFLVNTWSGTGVNKNDYLSYLTNGTHCIVAPSTRNAKQLDILNRF